MADLTAEEVARLAAALGIVVDDEDLEDVTFRVNALLERLGALADGEPRGARGEGG